MSIAFSKWLVGRLAVVLLVALTLAPAWAAASIVRVDANNDSETNFDGAIRSDDLINAGRPSLAGTVQTTGSPNFPASGSNDGTATHTNGLTYYDAGGVLPGGNDLTYTLNTNAGTGGSATGYDINTVNAFYGWQDSRYRHAAQEWTLQVSTLANPTFTSLQTVVYTPYAAGDNASGSTLVTLTDTSGAIARGVTAIRFHLNTYGNPGDPGYTGEIGVVREFDVIGIPSVPEPASLWLFGSGLVGLSAYGARRRRA